MAALEEAVRTKIVVGDGQKEEVTQGPLVNKNQLDDVTSFVEDARKLGANITYGGAKHDFGDLYYQPTILTGMTKEMKCYKYVLRYRSPLSCKALHFRSNEVSYS